MNLDAVATALEARLPGRVERAAPSAPLTTYRCGGPLAVLVRVDGESAAHEVAAVLATQPDVPGLVIGRGSNLLIADRGFAGVALVPGGDFERLTVDPDTSRVGAGSAVALPVLARQAAKAGIGGLEFFVGIPGSVGGAVRMNAGGHGAQTADVLVSARVLDLGGGGTRELGVDALALGYRRSVLRSRDFALSATFAGAREDPTICDRRIDEIVRWRREHQPGGQNAGSVFTNPPGDAAGRLIEAAGCKGLSVGGVVVSEKHANFFAASPGAHADDVLALVRLVQSRVEAATGVRLELELQLIGFADTTQEVGG
ncbi:MAG: UDP-N-acetylmuramate dehydrogenase [Actinomycetota bacterium]|jgi:UDP-N-acetylmuramate dehydrogenase|nr:UDP-N-acetylmuramate dehydrogenase [Actinomycetota bacterium]